jgi:hypothetical protein
MTRPPHVVAGFRARLRELYDAAEHNRPSEVFRHLRGLVPEYQPTPGLMTVGAPYPDDF